MVLTNHDTEGTYTDSKSAINPGQWTFYEAQHHTQKLTSIESGK